MKPIRLAIVVSHPIQYFVPWYREAARREGVELRVFYCCDWGLEPYHDPDFDREVQWDLPLLDGYPHEFLPIEKRPEGLRFSEVDNPAVTEALEEFRPEVLLLHGYAHRTHWRATAWARRHDVRCLIVSDSDARAQRAVWKRITKSLVLGFYYRRLDGAYCVGEHNRAYHRSFGLPDDRLFEGVLPVDGTRLRRTLEKRTDNRESLRASWGAGPEALVALYCGKLVGHKRPVDLLRAVGRAREAGSPVVAVFAGDGPLRDEVSAAAAALDDGAGVMLGFVAQRELAAVYDAADVLVLPSEREAQGLVITEAGALGTPSIVSDRVGALGPDDAARPGVNVLSYPCGDVDALADLLASLSGDRKQLDALGSKSRAIADGRSPERAAELLERALQAVVALGSRGVTSASPGTGL